MMAIDTSALMAVILDEPMAPACVDAITAERELCMSSGTLAECLVVAATRGVGEIMTGLLDGLGLEFVIVDADYARRVAAAYARWGKGRHPAGLNFGDCFAYELARERKCPLLFVGKDFERTDVQPVLIA
jgi:ribonuclease VapC